MCNNNELYNLMKIAKIKRYKYLVYCMLFDNDHFHIQMILFRKHYNWRQEASN